MDFQSTMLEILDDHQHSAKKAKSKLLVHIHLQAASSIIRQGLRCKISVASLAEQNNGNSLIPGKKGSGGLNITKGSSTTRDRKTFPRNS
jgi:hypothetical protein